MSYSFSTRKLAGLPPSNASATGEARRTSSPLRRAWAQLRTNGRRRSAINELSQFSERELADIGLNRADVPRVFDPAFAAEYAPRN